MLSLKIDTSALDNFVGKLEEIDNYMALEQRDALTTSLILLQDAIEGRTPVNLGNLRGSIDHLIEGTRYNFHGEVFTDSIYGYPVEYGRKPGKQPPTDALEAWVVRKLGVTRDEARGVAYVIARAIGRKGTQGAFMFRDGFAQTQGAIVRLHEQIPAKVWARLA